MDTNALVSGLLNPDGAPGRVVDLILGGHHRVLYDDRILAEYMDVLARPSLKISDDLAKAVVGYFRLSGDRVTAVPLLEDALPDQDDLPFLEVAISGEADALVTGNARHFPAQIKRGVKIESPAAFLAQTT
ncbi:MAG TPA: putative toxin-antitoxin system toxin component, PIN family [Anaerolineaceae bacterium]|nr:putative toxin-antitoxin system toxin component, PIN family [Anaerolineaceae bacterium]